ncbi:MAG: 3-deoxy-7-phosphoheptulonate synthase [Candidatus Gracilibacteria bacterium]|jgi:3-deoxy-7-phosphoheptulonate synthase
MIIIMKRNAPETEVQRIIDEMRAAKLQPMPLIGTERVVIAVIGDERGLDVSHIKSLPGVSDVMPVLQPYKLAARDTKHENTIIDINGVKIGGKQIVVMAGPCSVESEEQINESAKAAKKAGATILRGGAFKPRTTPYAFQGMGEAGLKIMRSAADSNGLLVVTELMDTRDVNLVSKYSDIVQIGTRNMQNFNLLKEIGKTQKPVLLKRGLSSTIKEWLLAAEYIMSEGNHKVMLCERGIRTFEPETRNTFDINAIPLVKELSHLPVIADPSHGTGKRILVAPVARAAIAAGADGLIIEMHPHPDQAMTDGDQSVTPEMLVDMMKDFKKIAKAVGREL